MFWHLVSFMAGVVMTVCIFVVTYGGKCKECQASFMEMLQVDVKKR
jgi:hypothetical protein